VFVVSEESHMIEKHLPAESTTPQAISKRFWRNECQLRAAASFYRFETVLSVMVKRNVTTEKIKFYFRQASLSSHYFRPCTMLADKYTYEESEVWQTVSLQRHGRPANLVEINPS